MLVDVYCAFGLPVVPEDLSPLDAVAPADVVCQINELINLKLLFPLAYPLLFKRGAKTREGNGMCWDSPC